MKPIDITNKNYICFRCLDYRGGQYRKEDNAICRGCFQTVFVRTLIPMCTECDAYRCLQCIHDGNNCDCKGNCYHCDKEVNMYDDGLPCKDCHKRYCVKCSYIKGCNTCKTKLEKYVSDDETSFSDDSCSTKYSAKSIS